MPAGLQIARGDADTILGQALRDVNAALIKTAALRDFLQTRSNQELLDLGYSQGEVDAMISAFNDMDQLWKIYRGAQALAEAKDFRQFAKRLWGFGI